ncbi:MAG: CRTAC1 family protein, partial [Planctomycetota bacterium]
NTNNTNGKGLGVVIADLDGDRDNDVYVTNDTVANFLYENIGGGHLQDVSLHSGASLSSTGVPDGSMGVDVCDYNNDGLPDIWVVNYERETNAMYQNAGGMVFRHVSQRIGLNAVGGMYVGWGTTAQDFDRDGDEDFFVSNGHVIRYPQNTALFQVPLLLENEAGRRLVNRSESAGPWLQQQHMGRGAVAADFDGDGDADLAISRTRQPAVVLENASPPVCSRWLSVRLVGRDSARDPTGAAVRLVAGTTQSRFIRGGGSYGASQSACVTFAVPNEATDVQLEIEWPSGQSQQLQPQLNRCLTIVEPVKSLK